MILMRNIYRLSTLTPRWLTMYMKQTRCFGKTSPIKKTIVEPLTERHIIRVKGDEVVPFLQGLITNDIKHLHPSSNKAIYAMFLNKAGRVLYDTIVYSSNDPNKLLIECDKNIANDLSRHLRLYRVRRSIDIDSVDDELKVWQAFNPELEEYKNEEVKLADKSEFTLITDPRLKRLGIRIVVSADKTFSDVSHLVGQQSEMISPASDEINFRLLRYRLGVAEGVIDMPPGKCFPLEANCDLLNGVSFHKGCYIGQELTARVHHTGMIRKRHMPVRLLKPLAKDDLHTVHNEAGANCGILLGTMGDRALGLLRIENVLKAKELLVNGTPCETEKPLWWPQDLHAKISIRKEM